MGKITTKKAHMLAFMAVFSIGGGSWSLSNTTTSHHPTSAAVYMLVENPPGEGMKQAISRSGSWEMETEGLAALWMTSLSHGAG